MDCLTNKKMAAYCSSELTSGLTLYSAMEDAGVVSPRALKCKRGDEWYECNIIGANKERANSFAASIRRAQGDGAPVISPAPFDVRGWEQQEYYAFWEELIRTRISAVHFADKWEYSNGCTFEYAVALDKGIDTLDEQGQPLPGDRAILCIKNAIDAIAKMKGNYDTAKLKKHLGWIEEKRNPAETTIRVSMRSPQ
jgi:hypothetical protein